MAKFKPKTSQDLVDIDMSEVLDAIDDVEDDADDPNGSLAAALTATVGDQICKPIREKSPVDFGTLRNSTYLKKPKVSNDEFTVIFGQGVDYAAPRLAMNQAGNNEGSTARWFEDGMYQNTSTFEKKLAIRYFRNLKFNKGLTTIDPRWQPSNRDNPDQGG